MSYLSESLLPHLVCYLRFIHFPAHFLFLYRALASTAHMQHILIAHSTLDEHLNWCHFPVTVNRSAANKATGVRIFAQEWCSEVTWPLDFRLSEKPPSWFPQGLYQFILSPLLNKGSCLPIASLEFAVTCFSESRLGWDALSKEF